MRQTHLPFSKSRIRRGSSGKDSSSRRVELVVLALVDVVLVVVKVGVVHWAESADTSSLNTQKAWSAERPEVQPAQPFPALKWK